MQVKAAELTKVGPAAYLLGLLLSAEPVYYLRLYRSKLLPMSFFVGRLCLCTCLALHTSLHARGFCSGVVKATSSMYLCRDACS